VCVSTSRATDGSARTMHYTLAAIEKAKDRRVSEWEDARGG